VYAGSAARDNEPACATGDLADIAAGGPADIPVEQASTFELVVNNKTTKTLRLNIPEAFLLRADQVIELLCACRSQARPGPALCRWRMAIDRPDVPPRLPQ
jgi:hypothetical protein